MLSERDFFKKIFVFAFQKTILLVPLPRCEAKKDSKIARFSIKHDSIC